MTPQTAVMSALLCDLTEAPAEVQQQIGRPLLRALGLTKPRQVAQSVDPDYAESVATGFIQEDVDAWFASLPEETR